MTRYEELEETHAEVKLKQLLWDAQKDWEEANGEWMEVSNTHTVVTHTIFHNRILPYYSGFRRSCIKHRKAEVVYTTRARTCPNRIRVCANVS